MVGTESAMRRWSETMVVGEGHGSEVEEREETEKSL